MFGFGLYKWLTDNNKLTELLITGREPWPELLVKFQISNFELYHVNVCVWMALSSRFKPEVSMGIPLRVPIWAEKG